MSDVRPLPARPSLEQYRKIAEDLQQACKPGDFDAISGWAESGKKYLKADASGPECKLSAAQSFVAREHGFSSWPKFVAHLKGLAQASSPTSRFEAAADAIVAGDSATLARLLRQNPELVRER